jgi:hypothetical protein
MSSFVAELIEVEGYGDYRHFQQYSVYILAVSFIGEGNRSTRRNLSQVTDKLYHVMLYRGVARGYIADFSYTVKPVLRGHI